MKIRYVIATSQDRAEAIVEHAGYPRREDAENALAMLREGSDLGADAAADYAVWEVHERQ